MSVFLCYTKDKALKFKNVKGCFTMDNTENKRTKCISIYNQKGGVAKTTTSVCCAQIFGEALKKNVLLIDFDSQGSASLMTGIETWDDSMPSIGTLMSMIAIDGKRPAVWEIMDCITRGTYEYRYQKKGEFGWKTKQKEYDFDILPVRGVDLSVAELALHNEANWVYKNVSKSFLMLKMIVDTIINECNYDYIIIDSNPSLSAHAINALFASDYLIVPTTMTPESINGISAIFARLEELNLVYPYFEPLGILYQKFSGNRTLDKLILNNTVFEPFKCKIPDVNTKISKSINEGIIPVCKKDKSYAPLRKAYIDLCKEIEERIDEKEHEHGKLQRVFI